MAREAAFFLHKITARRDFFIVRIRARHVVTAAVALRHATTRMTRRVLNSVRTREYEDRISRVAQCFNALSVRSRMETRFFAWDSRALSAFLHARFAHKDVVLLRIAASAFLARADPCQRRTACAIRHLITALRTWAVARSAVQSRSRHIRKTRVVRLRTVRLMRIFSLIVLTTRRYTPWRL